MSRDAVWTSLWKAVGLVSVASIIFACVVARVRWRYPSLGVRVTTTVCILVGLGFSVWLVASLVGPSIQSAQSQDVWVLPSPIFAAIPAIVGALVGGIYSVYLRQRDGGRVA